MQLGAQPLRTRDAPHRHQQRDIVDVRRDIAAHAGLVDIADRHRMHPRLRTDGRLEQRCMERPHHRAVGGRTFRKHRDTLARHRQPRDDAVVHLARVGAPGALDEQRADARRQPAEHRPAADLRLRHEQRRADCVDHPDVEPGHMVGCDEHRRIVARQFAMHVQADVHHVEQRRRPGLHVAVAQAHVRAIEHEQRDQQPAHHQRRRAGDAPGTDEGAAAVSARHPRCVPVRRSSPRSPVARCRRGHPAAASPVLSARPGPTPPPACASTASRWAPCSSSRRA